MAGISSGIREGDNVRFRAAVSSLPGMTGWSGKKGKVKKVGTLGGRVNSVTVRVPGHREVTVPATYVYLV